MFKNLLKRRLSLLLALVLILTLLPIQAYAADLNTGITGLSASYDNGTWSISGNTINGSVTTKVESGCMGDTYTAVKGTLTFKNSGTVAAILTYNASLASGSGSITDSGNGSITLQPNASTAVSVTSNDSGEDTSVVTISDISFTPVQEVTVTFQPAANGSYKVDGTAVTAETQITRNSDQPFVLVATPASGYKFIGWKDVTNGKYLSFTQSESLLITSSITVVPEFVASSLPIFHVSGMPFTDLNTAISYAQTNNKDMIVLAGNGTLPAGSYTIPNGKTLLIPFDDAYTCYRDEPPIVYNSHTNPTAFRTLTMANGANITVANGGAISLSGKLCSQGQLGGWNGCPTGPDGRINMLSGSSITVQNGGNLYVWGYIYGSGAVIAQSGATVYEAFQIKDWRGGTATSSVYQYAFILNQYYVQNIEVPLTLYAGATENLYSAANASGSAYPMGVTFIGRSSGMFRLTSGYLVKDYIESTDRLEVKVHGNAEISPMSMSGLPIINSIDTSRYVLPITSNITIDVQTGTTQIKQDISLLPGVEIHVASGASMTIASGKKAYVYDNDEWGNFTGSARLYVIGYSVANGTTAKRNENSLKDVKVTVDGTVQVAGDLYTSASGADITTNGSGRITFTKATATTDVTLYECADNKTKTAVTFTAAKLHNGDGSYTATAGSAANTTFYYCKNCVASGKWETEHTVQTYTVTWKNWDGTVLHTDSVEEGEPPVYTGETPSKAFDSNNHYTFSGWDPAPAPAAQDTVYTAQFTTEAHSFTESETTAPTCTQPGVKTLTCACGYSKTEQIPVTGHTPAPAVKENNVEPTCTTGGGYDMVVYCSVCGAELSREHTTVPMLGHDWDEGTIDPAPTCTEEGVKTFTCSRCGKTMTEAINPTGHTAGEAARENEISATCTAEGGYDMVVRCTVCDAIISSEHTTVSALGHDYQAVVTAPTCTAQGYTTYTCSRCGDSYVADYVDPTGHTPGAAVKENENPATCTVAGGYDMVVYCSVCGEELSREHTAIPVLGHTWGEPAFDWSADYLTCQATFTCQRNPDHTEILDAAVAAEITKPATGTEKGETTYTATVVFNGETYTDVQVVADIPMVTYTVTWVGVNGEELEKDENVPFGTTPSFDSETPVKPADAYNYRFVGWSPELSPVTGDVTYTARFVTLYTVTWVVGDRTFTQNDYCYGERPVFNSSTDKPGDAQYSYTFIGWDKEITSVTDNVTYTALYEQTTNTYAITWKNWDGTVLRVDNVEYGATPDFGSVAPARPEDAVYAYTFSGWTPIIVAVKGNATYTASYSAAPKSYTIHFEANGGDGTMDDMVVSSLETATLPTAAFTKSGSVFLHWNTKADGSGVNYIDGATVQPGDLTLYAIWGVENVKNGLIEDADGELRYYVDGVATYAGLVQDAEGNYYYINSSKKAVKGMTYSIGESKTNGLLPAGKYSFDATGKMIDPPTPDPIQPSTDVKQGIVRDDDGKIRYYVDGVATYAGLVRDSNGNYYYFNSTKVAVTNRDYTIGESKTNGLLPAGKYHFDENGQMTNPPAGKNGLSHDDDGEIRYYVNGIPTYAGLVQDEHGNLYYINSAKKAVKNMDYSIGANKTNGLAPAGMYHFDENGIMSVIPADTAKNGLQQDEDGKIRFYVDGVAIYAGLVQDGRGNYYYINSAKTAVTGRYYGIFGSKTNDLLPEGVYYFEQDGKLNMDKAWDGTLASEHDIFMLIDSEGTIRVKTAVEFASAMKLLLKEAVTDKGETKIIHTIIVESDLDLGNVEWVLKADSAVLMQGVQVVGNDHTICNLNSNCGLAPDGTVQVEGLMIE